MMQGLLDVLYIIAGAVLIGMTAAALPPLVRAIPLVQRWVHRGIKPWACDLCMSVWSTIVSMLWWWGAGLEPLAAIPAFVVTFAIVRYNSEAIGPPPGAPALEDMGMEAGEGIDEIPFLTQAKES